ncbi:cytochrome P450 [Hydrocarboniclastica marina]|uniref:Cytochrome P450 n=1 Tax=Hydrocarboniclastica marina TaxID=2259620 RepID=A0A4P7XEN9_9ALTE|nr:cytochrome P450 [Hydrocarboniclastica marina]QCF25368.1 cytochrome P450 [Hydrocarboniclastica marina]
MHDQNPTPEWDPHADTAHAEQLGVYDELRQRCPVAYSEAQQWTLFRHRDVLAVLNDHATFSNAVSSHLSVPNGMDPPEHTPYRQLIEPFFGPDAMARFEPVCRSLAKRLVEDLAKDTETELIRSLAQPYAAQVQCAFLNWPVAMHQTLNDWSTRNQAAIAARDREALARYAEEFTNLIIENVQAKREAGADPETDVTMRLATSHVNGRLLRDEEIVSILRNWTAGEVGTMAASVGILVQYLAEHTQIQQQVRDKAEKLPEAIDEILRIHGPLLSNRRVTTCPVAVAEQQLREGERLTLLWPSANRDETVFEGAGEFRWGRDPEQNLLWGAGVHVCPGAPLARMELRIIMEELLADSHELKLSTANPPVCGVYPATGFARLPVIFR